MYVIRYRLYFLSEIVCIFFLQIECRLCFLSSSDRRDDISMPVATVDSSRDRWMMSPHSSLLRGTVATDVFCPSLLSYNCSDALVVTGRLSVTTVTYDSLLQCMFVVVTWTNASSTILTPWLHISLLIKCMIELKGYARLVGWWWYKWMKKWYGACKYYLWCRFMLKCYREDRLEYARFGTIVLRTDVVVLSHLASISKAQLPCMGRA
jgi:hypothetical protein